MPAKFFNFRDFRPWAGSFLLSLFCLVAPARSQPQSNLIMAYAQASKALERGQYLEAEELMRPLAFDSQRKSVDETELQMWIQIQIKFLVPPEMMNIPFVTSLD